MIALLAQSMAGAMQAATLAWTPLLEPLHLDRYWYLLLVPMVASIAVTYKAIKLHDLRLLPAQAFHMMWQILAFMVGAAGVIWLVTEVM